MNERLEASEVRGGRVLVVDDDPDVREAVETALELEGHKVATAADGLAALKRLGQVEFDAVVLDVLMPNLDGFDKGHIRTQFLSEAILLAVLGGAVGVTLGILATAVYAHSKNWTTVIPTLAWAGGLAAAMAIGAIAGLLPAIRAARLSPTDALRTL
jgi:ActR/RegA family two-component response regulator